MIIELFLNPIFALITKCFELIKVNKLDLPGWLGDFLSLLGNAMMFFPIDVWVIVIANIAFWLTIQFSWAAIEWIYRKIPGIN